MKHKHHIIPRHVFPKGTPKSTIDHPSNLFLLNITQHALAHRNLGILKIHRNSHKDWAVWKMMSGQWGKEESRQLLSAIACKTPEFRAKISALHIGKKRPPFSLETRERMSAARLGKPGKPVSQETRDKLSAAQIGKPRKKHTEETKAKIRASKIGKKLTLEHRTKIGTAHIGMKRSEETKKKMSQTRLGKKRGKLKPYKPRIVKTINITSQLHL